VEILPTRSSLARSFCFHFSIMMSIVCAYDACLERQAAAAAASANQNESLFRKTDAIKNSMRVARSLFRDFYFTIPSRAKIIFDERKGKRKERKKTASTFLLL
jgi:hypothetical protein